jgi:hypothetical protein
MSRKNINVLQEIPLAERNNRQKPEEDNQISSKPESLSRKASKKSYGIERASNPHKTLPKTQMGNLSHRTSITSKRSTKLKHTSSISSVVTANESIQAPMTTREARPEPPMYKNVASKKQLNFEKRDTATTDVQMEDSERPLQQNKWNEKLTCLPLPVVNDADFMLGCYMGQPHPTRQLSRETTTDVQR